MSPSPHTEDPFAYISRPSMPATTLGRVFMFYDLRSPDQLRISIQNALQTLIDTHHTYIGQATADDLAKQMHATSTRIESFLSLDPSAEDEEGEFVRSALEKMAPSVLSTEQVPSFLDPSNVNVWVRAAILKLAIPLSVKLGKQPGDYHQASALVLIGGNQPQEGEVVMGTRIVPPEEPSTDLERIRYDVTEATYTPSRQTGYRSVPVTSPEILFKKLAQTLARTIQQEARSTLSVSPPRP